jgi:putative aldouronate transport system substrate-binding protein
LKKRILIAILIVAVLLVAACSNNTANTNKSTNNNNVGEVADSNGNTDRFKEKKEIEIMAWWPVHLDPDDAVIKAINEKFNVELKITLADWGPHQDNIATRVASGDYPNYLLMPWYWVGSLGQQYSALIEDGLAVNISEYVEELGLANIEQQLREAEESGVKSIYADSQGDYYSIPRHDGYPNGGLYIRKDWLTQLNLSAPKNMDELESVLEAFVKSDPDGKGTVGLTSDGFNSFEQIIATFTGINPTGWFQKDGVWTHKVLEPAFKDAIVYLHRLYDKGLIDKEFPYLQIANAREKFTNGRAGLIMFNANGIDFTDLTQVPLQAYKATAEADLVLPFPAGPAGNIRTTNNPYGSTGILFDTGDKELNNRMLTILDWLLSEEGTDLSLNGVEGIHHTKNDGKIVYNEEAWQKDFYGIEHHFIRHLIYPGVAKEKSPRVLPVLRQNYEEIIANGIFPEVIGLNTENTAIKSPVMEEIYTKWMVNFIVGDAEIEKDWNTFLNEWKAAGYDDLVKDVTEYMSK